MAENLTPEQQAEALKTAQEIAEAFENASSSAAGLSAALEVSVNNSQKMKDILQEQYGEQMKYMTSLEQEAILREGALEGLENALKNANELKNLQNELNDLKDADDEAAKKRKKELDRLIEKKKESVNLSEEEVENLKKQIDELKEVNKELKKKQAALDRVGGQLETQLQSQLGLQTSAKNFTQSIFEAGLEGAKFSDISEKIGKTLKQSFSAKNIGLTAMGKLADQGAKFRQSLSPDGLRTKFAELNKEFVKATGLTMEFGNEIKTLQRDLVANTSIVLEESTPAINALNEGFVDFTEIGSAARSELVETTARMARLGVDVSQTTGIIDKFSKGMSKSTGAATKITKEMFKFSRAIGVGPNKMLGQLNKNFDLVAKFGEKKGVEVFKKLAMTAKATGVEFDKLLGITKAFDTFESAAESAGKLNFLLGGPLLNSTELLAASEDERIEMVQKALQQSGKSFDQLGRFAKEAIASTLQVDVSELGKLMDPSNVEAAKDMAKGLSEQTKEMGSLAAETDAVRTRADLQREATQKQAAALGEVSDKLVDLMTKFDELMVKLAPVIGILGMFAPLINGVIALMPLLGKSGAAAGAELGAGGAAASAGWLPIIGTFLGIVAVIALVAAAAYVIYENWDELVKGISELWEGFTDSVADRIESIVNFFSSMGDKIAAIWNAIGESITTAWNFTIDVLKEGLDFVVDFFKTAANFIGSALIEAMFAFPTAIAMGFDWVAGKIGQGINFLIGKIPKKIRSMIGIEMVSEEGLGLTDMIGGYKNSIYEMTGVTPAFAEGTESAPGGMSLVGEEGPELVNLPGRTQVIPADQTREMMSTLERFNKITSRGANTGTSAPAMGGAQELNQTIVLQLDGEVLAKHTSKVTVDTLEQVLRPRSYN
jgi:phage-related minor tail protein